MNKPSFVNVKGRLPAGIHLVDSQSIASGKKGQIKKVSGVVVVVELTGKEDAENQEALHGLIDGIWPGAVAMSQRIAGEDGVGGCTITGNKKLPEMTLSLNGSENGKNVILSSIHAVATSKSKLSISEKGEFVFRVAFRLRLDKVSLAKLAPYAGADVFVTADTAQIDMSEVVTVTGAKRTSRKEPKAPAEKRAKATTEKQTSKEQAPA